LFIDLESNEYISLPLMLKYISASGALSVETS